MCELCEQKSKQIVKLYKPYSSPIQQIVGCDASITKFHLLLIEHHYLAVLVSSSWFYKVESYQTDKKNLNLRGTVELTQHTDP